MSELPLGWLQTRLGDVASFVMGQAPPGPASNFEGKGTVFIKAGEFGPRYPIVKEWTTQPLRFAKAGDVLICVVGATAGKLNLAIDCAIGRSVAAIRPTAALRQDILYYQLISQVKALRSSSTGSAQGVISSAQLSEIRVVIPPLGEQERIARIVGVLRDRTDVCQERFDRVPQIMQKFREAVLEAAVSGRLTEEWRAARKSPLSQWRETTFEAVSEYITVGHVGKMSTEYVSAGVPFLRSLNVRPFRFDRANLQYVSESFHRSLPKSALQPGDVVVVRSGAPGQCCVIPPELERANCSDLVILRPGRNLNPYFACIYINAAVSQRFVRSEQVGVAQAHFNIGSMKKAPLRLPSGDEQAEIVRRVDELFALSDSLQRRYDDAVAQIETLTPSILAKAFRGKLVPQDPNDEPAERMLERICRAATVESVSTGNVLSGSRRRGKNSVPLSKDLGKV